MIAVSVCFVLASCAAQLLHLLQAGVLRLSSFMPSVFVGPLDLNHQGLPALPTLRGRRAWSEAREPRPRLPTVLSVKFVTPDEYDAVVSSCQDSAFPARQVGLEEAGEGEEDRGRAYERKLEYLRREEELIREEQMEAEALLASEHPTISASQV